MGNEELPWTRKYSPKGTDGFFGTGVRELVTKLKAYKKGKAILLVGKSGTGKSASVYAITRDEGWEILELNASDFRNAEAITTLLGAAIRQQSLFAKKKLILIDDLDGISGKEDRGGVQALLKIIDESKTPIVITANDVSESKFSALRRKCKVIEYPPISLQDTVSVLKEIARKEHLSADEDALRYLARISEGDMRAAMNDLQALSGLQKITREDVSALGFRDRREEVTSALLKVFKTKDIGIALQSFESLEENVDDLMLWMEENIPMEYEKAGDLARAFDAIAEADRFRGRIKRWQYYRFWVYCNALLSVGVALAKDEKYTTVHNYQQNARILKIWIGNQKNLKRKAIAAKIAEKTHTSTKRAIKDTLPFLLAACRNKQFQNEFAATLRLDAEEIEWLRKH